MPIKVSIVTAEQQVLEDVVDMVIAPGVEGQLGILPRHAPLLTALQPGELRLKKGGTEISLAVTGGFLEVRPDQVTVLADAAIRSEEIDLALEEEAVRRAKERLANRTEDVEVEMEMTALRYATMRIQIARRHRPPTGLPPMQGQG